MDRHFKVRENRLRRVAERRGLRLEKSRRRDPNAIGFGGYMLVDTCRNFLVLGGGAFGYSATLDDVESYLDGDEASLPAAPPPSRDASAGHRRLSCRSPQPE
jgi:hypothetical protein